MGLKLGHSAEECLSPRVPGQPRLHSKRRKGEQEEGRKEEGGNKRNRRGDAAKRGGNYSQYSGARDRRLDSVGYAIRTCFKRKGKKRKPYNLCPFLYYKSVTRRSQSSLHLSLEPWNLACVEAGAEKASDLGPSPSRAQLTLQPSKSGTREVALAVWERQGRGGPGCLLRLWLPYHKKGTG